MPRPQPRARAATATVLLAAGLLLCQAAHAAAAHAAAAPTGKLLVRVSDAGTGKPIAARLSVRASDGTYPGDRIGLSASQWPNLDAHGVFVDGEGAFELPPGEVSVVAARGPAYLPSTAELHVVAGETRDVNLALTRVVDLRALGWVGGDAHVHMIHGEMQRPTSYTDVAATCRAQGLDWAYVGQEYVGSGTLDLAGYHAECAKVSTADFKMFLGGERPKSVLGHHALIGVHDPFVVPDDPPYYRGARAVHAQGGVLFNVHPLRYFPGKKYAGAWLDLPGSNLARSLVFDSFCGPSFDGLSVLSDEPAHAASHQLWFNLLNRGLFVPAMADSDACFDRPVLDRNTPGFWMTYLNVGPAGAVEPKALAEAVRRGRTMATTGPLLLFSIDGQISGATLPADGKSREVKLDVYHRHHNWTLATRDPKSGTPAGVSKVELIRNGKVVKTWEPNAPEAHLTHEVKDAEPCWYAARAYGTDANWQVALASPIYIAAEPVPQKRPPFVTTVRGRVYDFKTGEERSGTVEVRRGDALLARFEADGQFAVKMPLDAEIAVSADGARPIRKELLLDYASVHRFLWYLQSEDLGKAETFERFERLVREVDLEFPLGHRMPGCYVAADLEADAPFEKVEVLDGPAPTTTGSTAVAAVLVDKERVAPGDVIHLAAVFRHEGEGAPDPSRLLVVEARAYDPARPTGFGALKKFDTFEASTAQATDLGNGYRMISGKLIVPTWARPGPAGGVDLAVRARGASADVAHVGLLVPLGETRRALCVASGWPTMPHTWHDHHYGIGPLSVCGRAGRPSQPRSDYRSLHLKVTTPAGAFDVLPARDGRGCADADDAVFTSHFSDQVLHDESGLGPPDPVRPQPAVQRRAVPVVDAVGGEDEDRG
jgi:hypothetical protein